MKKTVDQQIQFVNVIKDKFEEKIDIFNDLTDDDKLIKIHNIEDLLDNEIKTIWEYTIELNKAKENVKTESELKSIYDKIYPRIDYLFLYAYTFFIYVALFQYENITLRRKLLYDSLDIFRNSDYRIYYDIFKRNSDYRIYYDIFKIR